MISEFRGCIAGFAIGDSLGMPVEGLSAEEIKRIYGRIDDFLDSEDGLNQGEWTDDTVQMIILAESIIETIHFSPENFAQKLKKLELSHRFGPTSSTAIKRLKIGYSWKESGINSDTNGSAMRVAPIGLVYNHNYNLVENYAEIASRVTHTGSAAISASVAVAVAIAGIVNEDDEMISEVVRRAGKYDAMVAEKIEYAYQIRNASLEKAVKELGTSIMAYESVPFAFYCYFSSKTFESAVLKAVNAGGDTDTIGAITGALKGAEVGIEKIPEKFKRIQNYSRIVELADRLYEIHEKLVKFRI